MLYLGRVVQNKKRKFTVSSEERRALLHPANRTLIKRGQIASFVVMSVYIGFGSLVLLNNRPEQLLSNSWGTRGTVVYLANRTADVPTRAAALPCIAASRPSMTCSVYGFDRFL